MKEKIKITELDYMRLSKLVGNSKNIKNMETKNIKPLAHELSKAEKVDSKKIPDKFVRINSVVQIIDVNTNKKMVIKIVFPVNADFNNGYISVLSPLATALLGFMIGDTVEFEAPKGTSRIKILDIFYSDSNKTHTV